MVVRFLLKANFRSENGWRDAKNCSSHGRSNFISDIERRHGKFAKNEKAQSSSVMMFMRLPTD